MLSKYIQYGLYCLISLVVGSQQQNEAVGFFVFSMSSESYGIISENVENDIPRGTQPHKARFSGLSGSHL